VNMSWLRYPYALSMAMLVLCCGLLPVLEGARGTSSYHGTLFYVADYLGTKLLIGGIALLTITVACNVFISVVNDCK